MTIGNYIQCPGINHKRNYDLMASNLLIWSHLCADRYSINPTHQVSLSDGQRKMLRKSGPLCSNISFTNNRRKVSS